MIGQFAFALFAVTDLRILHFYFTVLRLCLVALLGHAPQAKSVHCLCSPFTTWPREVGRVRSDHLWR